MKHFGYNGNMIPVIICGGIGSKMWPLSTAALPKHFLPLVDGESLFQVNWRILRKRFSPDEIYIQTNAGQAKIALEQVPEILLKNIFIEPETKNQGPASGFAAANLKKLGKGEETFVLIQTDDLRVPEDAIFDFLDLAEKYSKKTGKYITSGFSPKWHQSGVDYLLKGKLLAEIKGVKIYELADFIDRSETEKIEKLLGSGDLLLHTNHTTMTPNGMLAMIKKYRPDWYEPLNNIVNGADTIGEYAKMAKGQLEEVTKHSHKNGESLVIENPFEWIDFGTWESVRKHYDKNNIPSKHAGLVEIDGTNNFCYSDSGKRVAVIGFSDALIIEGKDGILVCRRDLSGKVNEVN